ncbi:MULTISPECIES: GGDEF domain-containing phosphodiesterase [unclassified Motilimonas]|uniref:GGDEF domain-containing phosphodiesterase n=1 Tax=Motilimonas TaxID=1914248 RepID=UPI001E622377|nr:MULTISPECIES: GGDEF domain-containing phosphodiesterase [unclassified Motilimonas]MCE0556177.1 EAL domain-containing protein [Motilimonas sp. E26]MDO6524923.1 EAL domain-containing protein [Motilimonas sp. 1_MG-2023]
MSLKTVLYFGDNALSAKKLVEQILTQELFSFSDVNNSNDFEEKLQQAWQLILIDKPVTPKQQDMLSKCQTQQQTQLVHLQLDLIQRELTGDLMAQNRILKKQLDDVHSLLKATVNTIPDLIFYKDPTSRFMGCNQAFEVFAGQPEYAILGHTDDDFFEPNQALMCQEQDKYVVESGEILTSEETLTYHNGEKHLIDMYKVPYFDKQGEVLGLIGVGRDITEKRKAEKKLKRAAIVFENTQEGILITDKKGTILSVNPAFSLITGYSEEEALGNTPALLKSGKHDDAFYQSFWHQLDSVGNWHGEIINRRKNGEDYHQWLNISSIKDKNNAVTNYVATFSDLSELKQSEEKLQYIKYHDSLTGLGNRLFFVHRLEDSVQRARRNGHGFAIMHIDLDRFSRVNKNLGHNFGDRVLKEVAKRLTEIFSEKDVIARFGSDEYAIMIDEMVHEQDAAHAAKKLARELSCGLIVDEQAVYLNVNIGISLYPDDGETADSLLSNAEAALIRVKQDRSNYYEFYTEELTLAAQRQFTLENELRFALRRNEFELYYQPQLDLKKNKVVAVEGLIRWNHPTSGIIEPLSFLSVAKESELMANIDLWVIQQACLQAAEWEEQGIHFGRVAVNLSLCVLMQADLMSNVLSYLKDTGCAAHLLEFEVQEDVLSDDSAVVRANLINMSKLGVRLAIDDFGTGRSSLNNMKRVHVDKIKIAQDFIRHAHVDPIEKAIIKSIVSLGDNLGIDVVAEGTETDMQVEYVSDLGCHLVQGFHVSKPMRKAKAAFFLRCRR